MKYIGTFLQFILVVAVAIISILNKKNKAEKNDWGNKPFSIFDILNSGDYSKRTGVVLRQRAKIELHAYDFYIYARNNGSVAAKNVILHSKFIEPMDVSSDKKGIDIQPGEEINYFVNSFEDKKITKVTVSWQDKAGYHKRPFLIKQKNTM